MFLDCLKWSSECHRATAVLFPDAVFLKDGTTHPKGVHHYHFKVVVHKFLSFILSASFQMSPADPSHLKMSAWAVFKGPNVNCICCRNGCQVWECQNLGWEAWCTEDVQLFGPFVYLGLVLHLLASACQ